MGAATSIGTEFTDLSKEDLTLDDCLKETDSAQADIVKAEFDRHKTAEGKITRLQFKEAIESFNKKVKLINFDYIL